MNQLQHRLPSRSTTTWTLPVGVAFVAAGIAAIAFAWYHAGNTDQLWIQNQELISGGVGGLAFVVIGAALMIRDQVARSLAALGASFEQARSQPVTTDDDPASSAIDAVTNGPGRPRRRILTASGRT